MEYTTITINDIENCDTCLYCKVCDCHNYTWQWCPEYKSEYSLVIIKLNEGIKWKVPCKK